MRVVIDETTNDVHTIMLQTIYHVFRLASEIYDPVLGINTCVRLRVEAHL